MARKAHHLCKLYITINEINHCFTRRWLIHVKQNDLPRLTAIKAKIAEKKTEQSSGFDRNRTKLSETGRVPPPVEPRNRMLGPSQHYIFLVQNCIARENVIFFNTKFIFLVHNYIPSTNFIFVVETLYLLRGRKGGSRAQFTAIKKRKSRNTIINFRVSRFTENKLTHEKDLSPDPIYIILLTVVLMYFRKRSTRDCVVIGNVRFGFTALLCSRQAVA